MQRCLAIGFLVGLRYAAENEKRTEPAAGDCPFFVFYIIIGSRDGT